MKPRYLPSVVLFVVTPLIAEYLLGSLSLSQISALPVLCCMYGGGTVLIRETARASRRGWPAIVLLGLAYAVLEEAFATQSLFNPNYLHLRLLDYGYLPVLGIGVPWTVYVLALHVIWSVCVPIGLVEAMFPGSGETPWLTGPGRLVYGLLLGAGIAAVTAYSARSEHFMASAWQFLVAGVTILLLVAAAFRRRSEAVVASNRATPAAGTVLGCCFVLGSAFELTRDLNNYQVPWLVTIAALLALLAAGFGLRRFWSRTRDWSHRHWYAAAAGGLFVYCWWGYGVEVSLHGRGALLAHSVLVLTAVAALVLVQLRLRRTASS